MASVSDLVKIVAKSEDLDVNFVSVYARSAREGGKISHFGRGKNAAKMTPTDAANLIISVNAGEIAKDAPKVIDQFRALEFSGAMIRHSENDGSLSNVFHSQSNFDRALEKLIILCMTAEDKRELLSEAMVDGLGFPQGDISKSELVSKIDSVITMKISFMRPKPFVLISFRDAKNIEVGGAMFGNRRSLNNIERLITTTITQKTIRAVGITIST